MAPRRAKPKFLPKDVPPVNSGSKPAESSAPSADVSASNDHGGATDPAYSPPGHFDPASLYQRIITLPLQRQLSSPDSQDNPRKVFAVIIDLNLNFPGGRDAARARVEERVHEVIHDVPVAPTGPGTGQPSERGINQLRTRYSNQYVFARLTREDIYDLVALDADQPKPSNPEGLSPEDQQQAKLASPMLLRAKRAIHLLWPDEKIFARLNKSISTIKADAAHLSFSAMGENIVWAVLDSGIQGDHVHFKRFKNLEVALPLQHRDFTALGEVVSSAPRSAAAVAGTPPPVAPLAPLIGPATGDEKPLQDDFGHGTHVAGIIAGQLIDSTDTPIRAVVSEQQQDTDQSYRRLDPQTEIPTITGMAPRCKLLSLRVLDENGEGEVSSLIAAIGLIQELNGYGRKLVVHGVNISAGYPFYPEWFACGQSPICVEVDRLVKSGVVVVVSAGNTGYTNESVYQFRDGSAVSNPAGQGLSINDPGNAAGAITVGSTHRESPHLYGISYFSSKGPTGDGRFKPDLVAPGEKIISCAAGRTRAIRENDFKAKGDNTPCDYAEDSGTSMSAPHVSGAVAAFLSIRREYIGRSEEVKRLFLSTATDLGRDRYFQGAGLVDLMRTIQAV